LIASPSFTPSFPHVGHDYVHEKTLEFLFINIICFFKIVPQSLKHKLSEENLLAKCCGNRALFLLLDVPINNFCSRRPEFVPFDAFVQDQGSPK
jgi:hypothetical protein